MHLDGKTPNPHGVPPRRSRRESVTISYEAKQLLAALPEDPSLELGARTAVETSLGLLPEQQLVLVSETGLEPIAAAILRAAEAVDAEVVAFLVDDAQAKNEAFVSRLCGRLEEAHASVLVASVGGLPAAFRRRLITAGGVERRHAHMVGITEPMMQQAMRADYREVHALGERLVSKLGSGSVLRVETTAGTQLTIQCDPNHVWHNASGVLRAGGWTNLPGGEVFTTPASVDGVLVPDGGAWLPNGRELPRAARLQLRFVRGELVEIDGLQLDAGRALDDAIRSAEHGQRVGQVGFGTNTGVLTSIGSLLQDLKMPGFHLSLGYTCPELTSAGWSSAVEIPLIVRRPDVLVDGTPVMVRGRYARGLL